MRTSCAAGEEAIMRSPNSVPHKPRYTALCLVLSLLLAVSGVPADAIAEAIDEAAGPQPQELASPEEAPDTTDAVDVQVVSAEVSSEEALPADETSEANTTPISDDALVTDDAAAEEESPGQSQGGVEELVPEEEPEEAIEEGDDAVEDADAIEATDAVEATEEAASNDEDERDAAKSDAAVEADVTPHKFGARGTDDPVAPLTIHDQNEEPDLSAQAALPASYSSVSKGYVTPVRDQNPFGTCWAFSTMAAIESSMLRTGITLGKTKNNLDLSERHLAYFAYNTVADPLGGTTGDSTYCIGDEQYDYLDEGGYSTIAMLTLASWEGVAAESTAPYSALVNDSYGYKTPSFDRLSEVKLANSLARKDFVHVSRSYYVPMSDRADVKRAIQNYGAVQTSYCHSDAFYNYSKGAYYCPYTFNTNHAITIVGWNDNYSKSNFSTKPSSNGAWLVKNSWGTDWGNDGYFWISYADQSLDYNAVAYTVERTSKHQHVYQYDGSASNWSGYLPSGGKIANVFTAKANATGEQLEAVSFVLWDTNVNYSIQIYKNPGLSNPASGTKLLSSPLTGKTTYQGLYKVDLSTPAKLASGNRYSVVITLSKSNGDWISYAVDRTDSVAGFVNKASAKQSYYYAYGSWTDDGVATGANNRIKAYTSDAVVSTTKKTNPMQVSTTAKTVSQTTLISKAVTVAPISVTKAQGTVTYAKSSGSGHLSVNKSTGKVTVKKGTGTGTYSAKVKVKAAGNATYKALTKTVTVKITVKATATKANEKEPNDWYDEANTIKLGVATYGKTDFPDDDFYVLNVSATANYKVTITNDEAENGNLYVWTYDADHDNYGKDFSLDGSIKGRSASQTIKLKKGKNYFWVWGNSSFDQHAYHIKVTKA